MTGGGGFVLVFGGSQQRSEPFCVQPCTERLMPGEAKIGGEARGRKGKRGSVDWVVATQRDAGGAPQQEAEEWGTPVRVGEGLAAGQGEGVTCVEANASGPDWEWYHCHWSTLCPHPPAGSFVKCLSEIQVRVCVCVRIYI